jgi:aspartyl-tRNA(Asn)/glutamyl-tRNA(Gln) amidotransferase subunit C
MGNQKVSREEIKKIASLAKLDLTESELDKFETEFNSILDYVSQINSIDVSGIKVEHNLENYDDAVLQDDIVDGNTIKTEDLLKNATKGRSKSGYVVTSKIVEK